jgi:hypothetical protein
VDSFAHVAIASWNATLQAGANSHFIKLPLLQWYLHRYDQLLFIDDDVLVSPYAADVFAATPCQELGAVYEGFHKQGWHAMHGRAFCSLYALETTLPSVCSPEAVKRVRIFNSGVIVMSSAHLHASAHHGARALPHRCDGHVVGAPAVAGRVGPAEARVPHPVRPAVPQCDGTV